MTRRKKFEAAVAPRNRQMQKKLQSFYSILPDTVPLLTIIDYKKTKTLNKVLHRTVFNLQNVVRFNGKILFITIHVFDIIYVIHFTVKAKNVTNCNFDV